METIDFERIDSLKDTQTYDWGIEGYIEEDNGKPIRKITFYIREWLWNLK